MPRSRALAFVIKELEEVLPPVVFFAVGFNLVEFTTQLVPDDYLPRFANYMVATAAALVVGKAVLLANLLPFLRRFDTAPLIQPALFKAGIYFAVVFLVRHLEQIVEYLFRGGTITGLTEYATAHFTWHRFVAIQIWVLVLFLIYTFITELNALFGDGELGRILFTKCSTELKLTRRQRVCTMVKLSRLTEAHTTDELRDRTTAAHAKMIALIRSQAKQDLPPPLHSSQL
jgi:hypothetical protein